MGTLHSQSKEERSRLNFTHYSGTFSGSIRHLLLSETATDHANVDARFSALIDLGTAGYGEFLRRSAAAICPLEQALLEGKVECILPDWEERSRRAALRADLADFGIADPTLAQRPSLGEEAHQFGVLYVLEGSRLGARVLARRLLASPNLLPPARCDTSATAKADRCGGLSWRGWSRRQPSDAHPQTP
jgi:heme oxygenase